MINVDVNIKVALRALKTNKLRTALTMLGIIIGVASVIALLSLGESARRKVSQELSALGSNIIIIYSGSTSAGGARMGSGTDPNLSFDDAEAIKRECPSVLDVAPLQSGTAQVVYGNQNWSTVVMGSTASILTVREWRVVSGRPFRDEDVRNAAKVCLLGQTVAQELFGGVNPVGKMVRIRNIPFTVIGVLESKGQTMTGQDQDDLIYVPITTAQRRLFGTAFPGMVQFIMVKARNVRVLDQAEIEITLLLRQRHRIGPNQEDDFTVRNLTQMLEIADTLTKVMTILLGSIASISLLVGGIGIMNIMLVSVTERTREIGIRIAVGAKTWDIRLQFIIEAVTLSVMGGISGIIIGEVGSIMVAIFGGLPIVLSLTPVVLAFGFSALVGIFFGFYPAYKASLLNPIDALRYE